MRITGFESNAEMLAELGERIKDARIAAPLTREELATKSGVSARTIANLESGSGATLSNVISVLRALNMARNLEMLVPEQGPRPSDLVSLGKKRQRATHSKANTGKDSSWDALANETWEDARKWKWGEDR